MLNTGGVRQVVRNSYEKSAITFEQYAAKVIEVAKSDAEVKRRQLAQERIDFLRDDWTKLLRKSLKAWINPDVLPLLIGADGKHLDISRNPAKHIWQELSVLYKLPPKRTTGDTEDAEKYDALVKGTGFDVWWPLVELLANSNNDIVIWPDVIEVNGEKKLKHRYAVGNTITAIPMEDDPTEIECWVIIDNYADLDGKEHTRYRIWTHHWHGEFEEGEKDSDGNASLIQTNIVTDDDPPEGSKPEGEAASANPYGRMPQVLLRLTPWADRALDATTGADIADLTLRGGEDRQTYRYLQKVSGFKQGVATGNFDTDKKQMLDPGWLIKLQGEDARFQIVDWQLDLMDRLECQSADELSAAASHGINPERYKRSGNYQTGTAAASAERGLAEYRIRNHPIFAQAEAEYYRMVCIVCEAHGMDVPDKDAAFEVEHAQIAYPQDPSKQIEVERSEISLFLESHKTILKRPHPTWTAVLFDQYLDTIAEDIAAIDRVKIKHNVPNDPMKESASAEENGALGPIARDNPNPMTIPPGSHPGNKSSDKD